jgi:signal transduction histidine kinase
MQRSDSRPFGLLRYFTGASLAVVLAGTLAAGIVSAELVRAVFAEMERDDAANVGEYFVTEFTQGEYTPDVWSERPIPPGLRERALSDMRNFDLSELKLLDPDGSELQALLAPGQAESPRWQEGLALARTGRVALRWDAVGGWRSILFSAHPKGAIETYVPVSEKGKVVAIVKLRHSLDPVIAASQKALFVIVALSGLAGLAIFSVLTLLVWRADRIIRRQHAELALTRVGLEERNARLVEMERRKDLFYAALSHDLKSPLVSSQAGIRLALTDPSAPLTPRQRELLEDSSRSIDDVLAIISNLLDMARLEARADSMEKEDLDLKSLLDGVVATHRLMAAAHAVAIETSSPSDDVVIAGDRMKLLRVFGNLLSNAIKHADGRPVRIVLESSAEGARVTVHDDGAGVPVDLRDTVFERFARVPGSMDGGAGLGLAIVREFVSRHGGRVSCESEPGCGTSFVVELPSAPRKDALFSSDRRFGRAERAFQEKTAP